MIVANNTIRVWKEHTPAHWQVVPLKYVITYNEDKLSEHTDDDYEFDYVDIGSVTYGKGIENFQHMKFSDAPSRARRIVRSNDVIISTVRTYLKATAKIKEHDNPVIVSTGFMVMRARVGVILPDFLGYIAQSDGLVSEIECQSYGTSYPAINAGEIAGFSIPLPPLTEQSAIVRFLDSKCSAIDEAIERHKKIIEKLEEYRKAFIAKLITSGVNDNAELKDSKEEWCGNIPLHWDMVKIKYLFTIRKRIIGYDGPTVLSITQRGIMPKDITSGEGQLAASYANYQIVQPGDFAMNHMDLLTGWVDISQYSGVTSPDYRVFTLDDQQHNDPRYFLYMMQMFYFNRVFYSLGAGVSGLGRWRLQGPVFLNFKVPVPPYKEQREIADIIENKDSFIRHSIEKHEALISKLEEYRKSIIYNTVTGKIDCRTEAS